MLGGLDAMIGMMLLPLAVTATIAVTPDAAVPARAVKAPVVSLPADLDPDTPSPEWLAKMVRPCVRSAARATC